MTEMSQPGVQSEAGYGSDFVAPPTTLSRPFSIPYPVMPAVPPEIVPETDSDQEFLDNCPPPDLMLKELGV